MRRSCAACLATAPRRGGGPEQTAACKLLALWGIGNVLRGGGPGWFLQYKKEVAAMAKRNFWTRLTAGALIAGGLLVATGVAQDDSNRSDSSDRSSRTEQRDRSSSREESDRQSRDQGDQDRNTPWLGIWLGRPSSQQNQKGVEVERVFPKSPAARAGLEAGDIITAINGNRVTSPDDLINMIEDEKPGTRMKFTVMRDEDQKNMTVTLGNRQEIDFSSEGQGRGEDQFDGSSGHFGGFGGFHHLPPHAMQLEHDRRNFEQHERIENEIARLRQEVHELRDMLQQQLQRR
jgi:membrane-associated protease RseP (regulator of RpoE activity)